MAYTFDDFEKNFGYEFKNKDLLKLAFTHTTYVFEHHGYHYDSNQRLEFIGDAVLDLVIGHKLYDMDPKADEGYLSKTRSLIVCERSLATVARKLRIGELLMLGKGEKQSGGDDKDSTLSDVVESVIAAVYFDAGFEEAERVILKNLSDIINDAVSGNIFLDYKSRLLELAQNKGEQHTVTFEIVDERGPAHNKEFEAQVKADGIVLAKAVGKSKKDAEQKCAQIAIDEYLKLFGNKK
ncbi:MAG: ribonuclease III [Clostridiales bacterium]|nr:ribonuclease III [Clostridiales bacterium]